MTVKLLVGDVRDRIREIPDGSVDLVACSPPFLALRKYGDNAAEMGSERTPADFLDALLELTQEFRRVLTPHGSIAIELGDTYSGSGGAGGDYGAAGLRAAQPKFVGSAAAGRHKYDRSSGRTAPGGQPYADTFKGGGPGGNGWPLAKSLTLIPTLYPASLAYGWNMLNPAHTFDRWRVRNVIVWARPNPPVGALGDKVRPATSYITVACTSAKRWFDLDAVRTVNPDGQGVGKPAGRRTGPSATDPDNGGNHRFPIATSDPAGAPPLDWWEDDDPTGHATLCLPTAPFKGAHYACWPSALAERLIKMMCPLGGTVLDPFAGTSTTLAAAQGLGRNAIGIELYPRNAELSRERCGMYLEIDGHVA